MPPHSSILAWRIPRTDEPGGLQSVESESDRTEQLSLHMDIGMLPMHPPLFTRSGT